MADDDIHVGIVGAGGNTTLRHIPGLQAIKGVKIISVCNRRRSSSERVAEQFKIPEIYDTWQELVAADNTDAIVIGTWPYLHCCVSLAALAANKHVMCEARMAMNAAEAHQMCDAAKAKPDLVAQIVPSPFTLSVDNTIKRLISENFIGEVLAIEIRDSSGFLDRNAKLHWRQDFELCGFNTLSLGIWYEAVMRWIGEATSVAAKGKTFVSMRKDEAGIMQAVRIPDHLDVIADMACGAQLHMQLSSVVGIAVQSEALIFGSEGTLRFAGDSLYGGRKGDTELKEIEIAAKERGQWRGE